jgi:hypothetical protein
VYPETPEPGVYPEPVTRGYPDPLAGPGTTRPGSAEGPLR